jgi:hypothetical protein
VKRKILIEPYEEEFATVNYYVIRFKDEEDSEFDKFFEKFDGDESFAESFNIIIEWLNTIGDEGGLNDHLRNEGGSLKAIPIVTSKLRLYCFKVNECIIILGNGGHKPKHVKAYQDDPELNQYVSDLRETGRKLINRIRNSSEASIYQCKLYGNLEFEIETT